MPFKIVETYDESKQRAELCICPSLWEKKGVLRWPKKKAKKLSKIEESQPDDGWYSMSCTVKRKNIITYEIAEEQLNDMLQSSTTTDQERLDSAAPQNINFANFNIIAQQALDRGAATMSYVVGTNDSTHQLNDSTPQPNEPPPPLNEPSPPLNETNETTFELTAKDVPLIAMDSSDIVQITSNQLEIYKNQGNILNDLSLLKSNYKKVLDNQQNILMAMAEISAKLDTFIAGKYENKIQTQVTKFGEKHTIQNSRFCLRPITKFEELSNLERILNDDKMKQEYKMKYSIVCQRDKAENCAYKLVDVFFTREFLTKCSWSGSAREGTKVCLKQYNNVLQLFFELVYDCDNSYTIAGNEKFFKSVLKNATKRKNSKLQRSSTTRTSHKRQKIGENPVNDSSDEVISNEAQDLVANEENRENISQEEPTSREEPAPRAEPTMRDDPTSQDGPTSREEPAPRAEPTSRDDPTSQDGPTSREEPAPRAEPTSRDDPTSRDEPTSREAPAPRAEPSPQEAAINESGDNHVPDH